MGTYRTVDALIHMLAQSVGPAVYEDVTGLASPPAPRQTWIDLQHEVVDRAVAAGPDERTAVAVALLEAILHQAAFGPSNRLRPEAFALILEAAPEALARSLDRMAPRDQYGGQRWLQQHVWAIPGLAGARWLLTLARADDIAANFLYQDMRVGSVRMWADEDWPDRIDAIAELPSEPRPGIVGMLPLLSAPPVAGPALVRVAMAHGVNERDWLVRSIASDLRRHRAADPTGAVDLVDWEARHRKPDLFRWLLELMGDEGDRQELVEAAVRTGRLPSADAAWFGDELDRPAWADGEVPWEVEEVVMAGHLRTPDGRLTAGDPWWTGGAEGLPWVLDLPPGDHLVHVIVASHPLDGRECAALHLVVDPLEPVDRWALVPSARGEPAGYVVEVGIAGFGAVEVYDRGLIFDSDKAEFPGSVPGPAWSRIDGEELGTLVFCTVGPQHQTCRTWLGTTAEGRPVGVVTDLGLLDLDLEDESSLPWNPPAIGGASEAPTTTPH